VEDQPTVRGGDLHGGEAPAWNMIGRGWEYKGKFVAVKQISSLLHLWRVSFTLSVAIQSICWRCVFQRTHC